MSRELEQLRAELEAAGYEPGTPVFEREYRRQKVEMCMVRQQVVSCWDCKAFDHCELIKLRLKDMHNVKS